MGKKIRRRNGQTDIRGLYPDSPQLVWESCLQLSIPVIADSTPPQGYVCSSRAFDLDREFKYNDTHGSVRAVDVKIQISSACPVAGSVSKS